MSNRMIVSIEPGIEDTAIIKLLKAPNSIADAEKPKPFIFESDDIYQEGQADTVKTQGKTILEMLKNAHPAVKEALNDALKAPYGEVRSIYIKIIGSTDAERLYWETLYDDRQSSFIALDRRWPIARIADSVIDTPITSHYFTMPLRVMAFISAAGIKGESEWESLYRAADECRQKGLPVNISVFVGERELLEDIHLGIQSQVITNVSVHPIPDRTSVIESELNDYNPHIVHFFCHGSASYGQAELELATIPDHIAESDIGSVRLDIRDLANQLVDNDVWLVTLNCCEGARATGNLHSMAHTLVASGIPAALGSLEPIDALDAQQFCESFYPALFDNILALLPELNNSKEVELEWAKALRPPRKSISERHEDKPQDFRQWALHVLYVRQERFNLRKSGIDPIDRDTFKEMKLRAETVAEMLRSLPPLQPAYEDLEKKMREDILGILDGYPTELRPDLYGSFVGEEI